MYVYMQCFQIIRRSKGALELMETLGMERWRIFDVKPGIHSAISLRFQCNFSKASTHTVREDCMRCKVKAHDLCAHTVRSNCRARFMCSHYGCIQKLSQLTCCLAALRGSDFVGSVLYAGTSRNRFRTGF